MRASRAFAVLLAFAVALSAASGAMAAEKKGGSKKKHGGPPADFLHGHVFQPPAPLIRRHQQLDTLDPEITAEKPATPEQEANAGADGAEQHAAAAPPAYPEIRIDKMSIPSLFE